jgi:SAM-dependent methyltransferase
MQQNDEFGQAYANEQLRRSKHPIRRIIKQFYLDNILADVRGPTLDVGCGAGQLLAKLPKDSLGLEINPYLITKLASAGLNVMQYNLDADEFAFLSIAPGKYKTIVVAHVIEHFNNAANVVRKLIAAANRLGVDRIIIVVPGRKGYSSDETHKTFVNKAFFKENELESVEGFCIKAFTNFPLPFKAADKYFVYQELKIVYEKAS